MRLLHKRKRLAACLTPRGLVRPSVGEMFAFGTLGNEFGALHVANAKTATAGVAEGKFVEGALRVLLAAEVIHAVFVDYH